MEFTILKQIEFQEVKRRFEEEYTHDGGTKNWTANVLNLTKDLSRGWALVRVRGDQLGDVLLPWYRSNDDANYDVIPPSGMLLSEVVGDLDGRIQSNAPAFVQRLVPLAGRPLGHIFLSEIIPRSEPTYRSVIARPGHFVCLDGLHRLIALGKPRLPFQEVELVVALA